MSCPFLNGSHASVDKPKVHPINDKIPSQPHKMTNEEIAIVKSTAPVLAEHGLTIVKHFYKTVFNKHPELKNVFSTTHQLTGQQPASLAAAVYAYAANIDNLSVLGSAVNRIAHKHASLGIKAEHYPIVGENLLGAIKDILGDAATDDILNAWKSAYQQLADILIIAEANLYKKAAESIGGWNNWRKFIVKRKVIESDEITSFYLYPVDGGALPQYNPGQYISVKEHVESLGYDQPRQYSLSDSSNGEYFRISVKRDSDYGTVSKILHDKTNEGAIIDVSYPYGVFTLETGANNNNPIVLISAGVGLTPMISMLNTLVNDNNSNNSKSGGVLFVHAVRNARVHAFKQYINNIVQENNDKVSKLVFYETIDSKQDKQGEDYDYEGRIDFSKDEIKNKLLLPNADYYLCGPIEFMKIMKKNLTSLGVDSNKIKLEVFGPEA